VFIEKWFGVEGIYLAWATIHEQKDAAFGFPSGMWWSGTVRRMPRIGPSMGREETIAAKQIDHGEAGKTSAHLPDMLPAGQAAGK
jgi:hypothetical protein